jgi:hypothetical protein
LGTIVEVLGMDALEQVVKKNLDKCFKGEGVHYEIRHSYPELGERELLVTYMPIQGPEGIDRATTIIEDITQRKRDSTRARIREMAKIVTRSLDDPGKSNVDVDVSPYPLKVDESPFRVRVNQLHPDPLTYIDPFETVNHSPFDRGTEETGPRAFGGRPGDYGIEPFPDP